MTDDDREAMARSAVQIQLHGRVQGVGLRAWLRQLGLAMGLEGWARNRHDGWVELVLSGAPDAIDAAIVLIERGPPGARIEDVAVRPAEPGDLALQPASEAFAILPDC